MAENGPPPNDGPQWSRHSKTLSLWVLIVVMSFLAIQFM